MNPTQGTKWIGLKKWFRGLIGREKYPAVLLRIEALLRENEIPYRVLQHPETSSASELAESLHVSGKRVAKVVIFRTKGRYVMAVLPSSLQVNLQRLARLLKVNDVSLATEAELKTLFPDCEVGAMPPLGKLYGLPVYVDVSMRLEPLFVFAAGTRRDAIEIFYRDFDELVKPKIGIFAAVPIARVAV
jgi:Ala-tRNA(Pro) deacylase